MEDVKLPDLNKLRAVKKRMKTLPPQKSATDTSNWENRNTSAQVTDTDKKKSASRELLYIKSKSSDINEILLMDKEVQKNEEQKRIKKSSK